MGNWHGRRRVGIEHDLLTLLLVFISMIPNTCIPDLVLGWHAQDTDSTEDTDRLTSQQGTSVLVADNHRLGEAQAGLPEPRLNSSDISNSDFSVESHDRSCMRNTHIS